MLIKHRMFDWIFDWILNNFRLNFRLNFDIEISIEFLKKSIEFYIFSSGAWKFQLRLIFFNLGCSGMPNEPWLLRCKKKWKRDILIASVLNCYKGCVNSITCPLVVSTGVVDPMCFSWLNTHAHTVTHRLCDCKSCEWQVNLPSHPWKAMGFGWVCVLCSSVGRRLSSWYVLNLYLFLSVFSWHIWVGSYVFLHMWLTQLDMH